MKTHSRNLNFQIHKIQVIIRITNQVKEALDNNIYNELLYFKCYYNSIFCFILNSNTLNL